MLSIVTTLLKFPGATGKVFSVVNIKKSFVLNGHFNSESKLVPDMTNILHTRFEHRGDIGDTCLSNPSCLCEKFYEEMFTQGIINDNLFDAATIPKDCTIEGIAVHKHFGVSQENQQHSKILSSSAQILERRKLVYNKKLEHIQLISKGV